MSFFLLLDLETTGLEPTEHSIIEVAARFITSDHKVLFNFSKIVKPPDDVMWSGYAYDMHTFNGLLDLLPNGASINEVDAALAERIKSVANGAPLYLMGNSVHFDRSFMKEHMPQSFALLHYRQLDVTSIRLWVELMSGQDIKTNYDQPHRADNDIGNSLQQAKDLWAAIQSQS